MGRPIPTTWLSTLQAVLDAHPDVAGIGVSGAHELGVMSA